MERTEILRDAIEELRTLAGRAGKTLTQNVLKNIFLRKKAYQKDWPQQILRKKATLIAGATVLAIGELSEAELLEQL